jgi:polyhydroxybutyrate depolymerase
MSRLVGIEDTMRIHLLFTFVCMIGCSGSNSTNASSDEFSADTAGSIGQDAGNDAEVDVQPADSTELDDTNVPEQFGPPAQNLTVNLEVDGLARRYRLYAPTTRTGGPMPLVVIAHGGSGSEVPFEQEEGFRLLSEYERVIIAYPLGYLLGDNEGEWQLNTNDTNRHDMNFIEAVIDDISSRYPVDASRVYGVGYSLGGMFVYEFACELSHRFAAIASQAGTMPVAHSGCNPELYTAIMHIHAVNDSYIPYSSAWDWKAWDSVGTMHSVPDLITYWQTKYGCQTVTEELTDDTTHFVHSDCDQGVRVEHHRLPAADHWWQSSLNGVLTPQVMWLFFSDFTREASGAP